jgi:hypothetical protein
VRISGAVQRKESVTRDTVRDLVLLTGDRSITPIKEASSRGLR